MSYKSNDDSAGLGIAEVLTLIFVVLKLIGVIDWPWIWVLSPLWIGVAVCVIIAIIVYGVFKKNRFGRW